MKRGTVIGLFIGALFAGFLLWSTLSAQRVECEACIEFGGRRNCAKASGTDEVEALKTAVSTACGPVTQGMAESVQCSNTPPVTRQCSAR
jgi:hypothetical protein